MNKLPEWQRLLHEFLSDNKNRNFEWGSWDCCKMADSAMRAISGESVIPDELDWHDESSAMKAISEDGGTLKDSIEKAAKEKGLIPIDLNHIQAGDLCVFLSDNKEVAGLCDGYAALSPTDGGFAFNAIDTVQAAWRIPDAGDIQ